MGKSFLKSRENHKFIKASHRKGRSSLEGDALGGRGRNEQKPSEKSPAIYRWGMGESQPNKKGNERLDARRGK